MAHKPVQEQRHLGRLEQPLIEPNTLGVLHQKSQFIRILKPGDGLSVSERLGGNLTLYIVDVAPHTLTWKVSLPSAHHEDVFPATITLHYRIDDPVWMIREAVADTEAVIIRVVEPELRRISRTYTLHQHLQADSELEINLRNFNFSEKCRIRLLNEPTVVFNFGDTEWQKIKSLQDMERATRVVQVAEHTVELPTCEPAYKFIATATVSYKVRNTNELPADNLSDAERQLWPKVQRVLRRASRQYKVEDIAQAEMVVQDAIDAKLDEDGIRDFGLEVVSVEVNMNQDDTAQMHAAALALAEHEAKLDEQKFGHVKARMPFYEDLIRKGSWMALALAVAKGQITEEELYKQMSHEEGEQLKLKISLLKDLRADDAKSEAHDEQASIALLDSVVQEITAKSANALPPTSNQPELTDSRQNTSSQNQKGEA